MIGNAVDRGRGDVDRPLDPSSSARLKDDPRADDVGGVDVFRRVERQRGRAMDDNINASQRPLDGRPVADVAHDRDGFVLSG